MLYLVAALLFFLAGIGSGIIPNAATWGLFFVALGLAFGSVISLPQINIGNKKE